MPVRYTFQVVDEYVISSSQARIEGVAEITC